MTLISDNQSPEVLQLSEALTQSDAEDCSIYTTCIPALVKNIKEEYTSRLVDILDVTSGS